ncbi:dihydropteroate synthase [Aquisalimonas asiatica]|uniref:Dihydropteroate synthase n=1 Tax=Aquisalimonas asiatica TaxID=406100 RepID=A0A1H8RXV4_9GAMM|nr:dihydropteroate synthase [Aquisalimonas asiatica]SEO71281.1 Dihydropteroate synthase [Aquisalimonas asiatica]
MASAEAPVLDCGGRSLVLDRPRVMGVVNITPDSFSDGGRYLTPEDALTQARRLVAEGADIIDIGGESTRPGSEGVSLEEELHRVLPVLQVLGEELDVPVSVDTSKPEVMAAAAEAGAGMINDVFGLRGEGALEAAAATGLPVCIMHMQGEPRTMQQNPVYDNVVEEVYRFLDQRLTACAAAGIPGERLVVDPGFGFGKTLAQNYRLLGELARFRDLGAPVLVGMSRKSMLGKLLDRPVNQRLHAGTAAATLAAWHGAALIRVHDVAATVDAMAVVAAARNPDALLS